MRRYISYSLWIISLLTLVVWLVSLYIQPILPASISSSVVIFFIALTSTIGAVAGFKEIIELFQMISPEKGTDNSSVRHNLPQPNYERFIGRQEELKRIRELLSPAARHFVITIDGVGGVGKTALALEIAYSYVNRYKKLSRKERFKTIVWTTAKKTELTGEGIIKRHQSLHNLEDIYSAIATLLNRHDILEASIEQQDDLVRHALTLQRSLLIVDNLETVDDERFLSFIKDVPAPTKVIVTTRHRLDVAYPIRLLGMSEKDALELIKDECHKKNVRLTEFETEKLIHRTGGVPLAIVWSIAQIGFGHTVEYVLRRLGQQSSDIANFCFEEVVTQIRGKPPYRLLMALAYLDNNADRETLGSVSGLPELDRDEGLITLEKLSLVNKNGNKFEALPLTLNYIKAELQKNPKLWLEITNPYLERYIKRVYEIYGTVSVFGKFPPIQLENFYTQVHILEKPSALRRFNLTQLRERFLQGQEPFPIEKSQNILEIIKGTDRLFILGQPGSGKTTLLKYVALEAPKEYIRMIPVFISLRELADSESSIVDFCVQLFKVSQFPSAELYVKQLFETGNALLLFDGLDEVSQEGQKRNKLIAQIDRFTNQYNTCKIIITARISTTDYVFSRFTYVEIADFGEIQVQKFINGWFASQPDQASVLLKELDEDDNKGLRELARNPLLLSLLCLSFEETLTLPKRRVDFYEEATDTLLRKWDASRSIKRDSIYNSLSLNRKKVLLSAIAMRTFEKGDYFIPERDLQELIINYMSMFHGRDNDIDGASILRSIEAQHGLLVERAKNIYSFPTLSIQEYFCAWFIVDEQRFGGLVQHMFDPRWREIFVFTASLLSDSTNLVELFIEELGKSLHAHIEVAEYFHLATKKNAFDKTMKFDENWMTFKNNIAEIQVNQKPSEEQKKQITDFLFAGDLLIDCLRVASISNREVVEKSFWQTIKYRNTA